MNNNKRHWTNEVYRAVHETMGVEHLRHQQQVVTGFRPTPQTVLRYVNGYGDRPIPESAYLAAMRCIKQALQQRAERVDQQ